MLSKGLTDMYTILHNYRITDSFLPIFAANYVNKYTLRPILPSTASTGLFKSNTCHSKN